MSGGTPATMPGPTTSPVSSTRNGMQQSGVNPVLPRLIPLSGTVSEPRPRPGDNGRGAAVGSLSRVQQFRRYILRMPTNRKAFSQPFPLHNGIEAYSYFQ